MEYNITFEDEAVFSSISEMRNHDILVRCVIAGSGQCVGIGTVGNVFVDGMCLDELFLTGKSFVGANLDLPYQMPDSRYFCMGDHRSTSADFRHSEIGRSPEE